MTEEENNTTETTEAESQRVDISTSTGTTQIGHWDGELHNVHLTEGDTVATLLQKASLHLGKGQYVNNEAGEEISTDTIALPNVSYYICGALEQGSN